MIKYNDHLNDGTLEVELPDGRIAYLWFHGCDSCDSLDVWTTRGNEVEPVSERTGDTGRAPMGLFAWANGMRATIPEETFAPRDDTRGWPACATVTLIWKDEK